VSVSVGGETYGSKDRFIKYNDNFFLVDDQTLRPLQYGKTRLLERKLHPILEADITTVTIGQGPKSVTFAQQHGDDRSKVFWSDANTPDTEHDMAGPWLGKVFKMRAKTHLQQADLPEGLEAAFTLAFQSKDDNWTVEVLSDPADPKRVYAKVSYLRGHVELTASLANDAMTDISELFPPE
jgi:hypothetical protein